MSVVPTLIGETVVVGGVDTDSLDDVDKMILHFLQEDARNNTTTDIGEAVGVSASTVGKRIHRLEERRVIGGYNPNINYERAGLPLHLLFVCTAPVADRTELATRALDVFGVVNVRVMLSGTRNVHVETVSRELNELDETTEELDSLGLHIESSEVIREQRARPFDHFGSDELSDG